MKKFIAGVIFGAVLATTASVYADEGLQKVEAYLRPTLPITLNGKAVKLESSPVMVDGSTYLKLRDVAGLTGLQVNWNDASQTVELGTSKGVSQVTDTSQSNVATTPTSEIKTTFSGLRAVTANGQTYFSPADYGNKYPDAKVWRVDAANRKITFYKKDGTTQDESLDDVQVIVIVDGESYLNTKYYPED